MFSLLTLCKFRHTYFLALCPSLYLLTTPRLLNPTLFIWCMCLHSSVQLEKARVRIGWSHFKFRAIIISGRLLLLPTSPVIFLSSAASDDFFSILTLSWWRCFLFHWEKRNSGMGIRIGATTTTSASLLMSVPCALVSLPLLGVSWFMPILRPGLCLYMTSIASPLRQVHFFIVSFSLC